MYLREKTKKQNGKTYTYYQLVESYSTPKGPRQRVVASLGDLSPRPRLCRRQHVGMTGTGHHSGRLRSTRKHHPTGQIHDHQLPARQRE